MQLGHVFAAAGVDVSQVVVLRHTYTSGGLATPADVTPENVLAYVRRQDVGNKLGADPRSTWVNFMADGGRRSRFHSVFDNYGEVVAARTNGMRYFDLRPSPSLLHLQDRLVVEWSRDAVNWAKSGESAAAFPVVELADPGEVAFPGFDDLVLTHAELLAVVEDGRYAHWRTALASVQGIYLIVDSSSGKPFVGKADGTQRILGRWRSYVANGHGGNVGLRGLAATDPDHRRHFVYSLLRVFGPSATTAEVNAAEEHFKRALLSRQPHGLNLN